MLVWVIVEDLSCVYDYIIKGNLVVVIINGFVILGFGNFGVLVFKLVMEGKFVLFKCFVDVDFIDLEFDI